MVHFDLGIAEIADWRGEIDRITEPIIFKDIFGNVRQEKKPETPSQKPKISRGTSRTTSRNVLTQASSRIRLSRTQKRNKSGVMA